MEIGGNDIILQVRWTPAVRELVETYFRSVWPNLVREPDQLPLGRLLVFPDLGSFGLFYFQDPESQRSWDQDGLTEDNHDTMIYVLGDLTEEETTFVVSHEPGARTLEMVATVGKLLNEKKDGKK